MNLGVRSLTTDELLAGAAYAVTHPVEYDQGIWCGTPCCVLGHARRLAGTSERRGGLQPGEYDPTTPREHMIAEMLSWTHADTAALMPLVRDDGSILIPAGGIGAFCAGACICRGA